MGHWRRQRHRPVPCQVRRGAAALAAEAGLARACVGGAGERFGHSQRMPDAGCVRADISVFRESIEIPFRSLLDGYFSVRPKA